MQKIGEKIGKIGKKEKYMRLVIDKVGSWTEKLPSFLELLGIYFTFVILFSVFSILRAFLFISAGIHYYKL